MDGATQIGRPGAHAVEGDGRAEIDHDERRMDLLPGRHRVDNPVGAQFFGLLDPDLHVKAHAGMHGQGRPAESAECRAGKAQPACFQGGHHRGHDKALDGRKIQPQHVQQAVIAQGQLVRRPVLVRLHAPTAQQASAIVQAAYGMRIAHIDHEKHAFSRTLLKGGGSVLKRPPE